MEIVAFIADKLSYEECVSDNRGDQLTVESWHY